MQAEFDDKNPGAIGIGTTARSISEGETLQLIENEDGNAWGGVDFVLGVNDSQLSITNAINRGTVTITKLDFDTNIVSGTFEMTVEDPFTGELVTITEGRFDTLFTQ